MLFRSAPARRRCCRRKEAVSEREQKRKDANVHLGSVEGLLEIIDELLLVAAEGLDLGTGEDLGSADALLLDGREAAGEDSLANEGDGHAEIEGVDGGPLSGSLLAGAVEDLGDEGHAIVVVVAEDLGGDLDEVGVEDTLVPGVEDCRGESSAKARCSGSDVNAPSAISDSVMPKPRLRIS